MKDLFKAIAVLLVLSSVTWILLLSVIYLDEELTQGAMLKRYWYQYLTAAIIGALGTWIYSVQEGKKK